MADLPVADDDDPSAIRSDWNPFWIRSTGRNRATRMAGENGIAPGGRNDLADAEAAFIEEEANVVIRSLDSLG